MSNRTKPPLTNTGLIPGIMRTGIGQELWIAGAASTRRLPEHHLGILPSPCRTGRKLASARPAAAVTARQRCRAGAFGSGSTPVKRWPYGRMGAALDRHRDGRNGQRAAPGQRLPAPTRPACEPPWTRRHSCHTRQGACRRITAGPPPKLHEVGTSSRAEALLLNGDTSRHCSPTLSYRKAHHVIVLIFR